MRYPLLALFLIFLVGCPAIPLAKKEAPPPTWRVGTQGLVLGFGANLPPPKIYDTEEFNVLIEIKNVGAYTVGSAGDRVYLSGFAAPILSGIATIGQPIPTIEGKSEWNPWGAFDSVAFRSTITRLTVDRYAFTLLAKACYGYETQAQTNICIDPQPFAPTLSPKVCTPGPVALAGGQAAPIAVTKIEQEPRPGRTIFRLTVQNVGGGETFRAGAEYLYQCSPYDPVGLRYEDRDFVQLYKVDLAGTSLLPSCKPLDKGHVRLTGGIGTVVCEARTTGATAYFAPLTIALRYGYGSWITKPVEIYRSP